MAAVMLTATTFVIRRIPNIFESRALIIVNLRNDEQSEKQMARFSALQQELTSRATLTALLRQYDLYPKIKDAEDAIFVLEKAIKTETKMRGYYPDTPQSVTITFKHTLPEVARDVVAELVEVFERANEQVKVEAGVEAERLMVQTREVEEQLKRLGPQRDLDMLRLQYLTNSRAESTVRNTQQQTLESAIELLRNKEFSIERQIADQRRLIAEQEKIAKSAGAAPSAANTAAYGQLLSERTKIEADLKFYSEQYTEKHPRIQQIRGQLAEINRQIARLDSAAVATNGATVSAEARELRTLQRELTNLERELDVVRHDLTKKTEALGRAPRGGSSPGVELAPLTNPGSRTEFDRLLSRYNWLRDKQDTLLKISSAKGDTGSMFQVIDAPNLSQLPVAPNRRLLQLLSLALALGFGLAVALAAELPRMFMINDDRDIEYYLGAPVLALIPETLTPIERGRKRKLRMTRALLVLMLAAALVPAFILLLNRLQVFQLLGNR